MSIRPIQFPDEVFARVCPDLYFERHLSLGLRPHSLRKFDEFRQIKVKFGNTDSENWQDYSSNLTLGTSSVRSDGINIVCSVTGGITEQEPVAGSGIYPNVEILRGGVGASSANGGAPSEEEMVASQGICDILRRLVNKESHNKCQFELFEKDLETGKSTVIPNKWLILNCHINVLSRNGPISDYAWIAVLEALKDVTVPEFRYNYDTQQVEIMSGAAHPGQKLDFAFLNNKTQIPVASSFGILNANLEVEDSENEDGDETEVTLEKTQVVIADIQGESEEVATSTTHQGSRVSVMVSGDEKLSAFSFVGVTRDMNAIKQCLALAKSRAQSIGAKVDSGDTLWSTEETYRG
ncbi:hypothetical protein NADFUDRAFT_53675 [Nadsonia fulvescens var. elongata DSM 6958]|uniref:Ribosomal RNA-processing protein 43 n=1 Tax=Nadsonia fulvescens var. elongata DSM 6958 TaxID=857566 RepID=A0A1E3PDP4_9ASCO|nr:hypothetical protein NADFUDRAFT_53675 [Nadsonia fulvescens var. elongata DSM 6958]